MLQANFFQAHQYCQYNNRELMTIDSKEEETAFMNLLNSKGENFHVQNCDDNFFSLVLDFEFKTAKSFWTSGNDLGEEGKFFYLTNGQSVGPINWAKDEPNNSKKPDSNETENCMAYTMTENLKFYRLFDHWCSLKLYFVCQEVQQKQTFSNVK